ncbi:MAG: substrate-binding domain-containing protein [Clostridiales Family XIII bacterium]|jgi:ABC-type sugar transport system substrate-binding protein|nr:substrate-binding domain-containing protein [Clostridiales Family XIII bacterium]
MKKLLAVILCLVLIGSLAACGGGDKDKDAGDQGTTKGDTIYVLGPTPDHGWTAQAGTYAEAKVKDINAEGKYKAEYIPASSGEEQVDQVNKIIADGNAAGVVFFALEDSAKAGQEALITENIPFISFDRIIEGPDKSAILNFSGDNWECGAAIAYWLQQKGLKPGDTLVTLIGDNGTVCSRRQEGFQEFLTGTREYHDKATGQTYKTTQVWEQKDIDALQAKYKTVCNWSADGAYQYLEQTIKDITADAKAAGGNLYVYSMDDEMTFGFMNLLEGNAIDSATKTDLEGLKLYISAIGGMQELYDVMSGASSQAKVADQYFDDMMSVYFSPKMMDSAINYMIQYLDNTDWTYAVGDGVYEPVWIVDRNNVKDYEGFTGH